MAARGRPPEAFLDLDYYVDWARTAVRGRFDTLFLAGELYVWDCFDGCGACQNRPPGALPEAILKGASLDLANLASADLADAILKGTKLDGAKWG